MSRAKDEEVPGVGIESRQHAVKHGPSGTTKYPFKAMVRNDFFLIGSWEEAIKVRNALKSFYRRYRNREFTVRQRPDDAQIWVVRRVA